MPNRSLKNTPELKCLATVPYKRLGLAGGLAHRAHPQLSGLSPFLLLNLLPHQPAVPELQVRAEPCTPFSWSSELRSGELPRGAWGIQVGPLHLHLPQHLLQPEGLRTPQGQTAWARTEEGTAL